MPDFTIRPVEREGDYEFGVKLLNDCLGERLGINYSLDQLRDQWKQRDNPIRRTYVAEIDGEPVGGMGINELPSSDGQRRFYLSLLIMPEYHSAALLSDLFVKLYALVTEYNPDELKMGLDDFLEDHIALAEARGFKRTQRDQLSLLHLNDIDFSTFAAVVERVKESGIHLVSLPEYEHVNPQYKAAIVELNNAIYRDVPGFGTVAPTLEQFEERVFQNSQILRDAWILALDGEWLVGMTYNSRFGNDEDCLTQLTGVIRSHRRRGITTAMKVKSFEILHNMGFKRVLTGNEENNPMYQINVRLGFKPGPGLFHYSKRMSPSI